ncbi:hypothetical protein [Rhodopseudomonas parapalustris]
MAAKKPITEATEAVSPEISDEAYYTVHVAARFKAAGVGFGTQSETQVTGALLKQLLAGEHADKVTGYTPV